MKRIFEKAKNDQGAALVYVLIVILVVSMYIIIISNLFQSNLKMAKYQEQNMKAYYLAMAGSDLTFTALLQHDTPQEIDDTLLFDHFNPTISSPSALTDTLNFDTGTASITVQAIEIDGNRWIEIESEGTLTDSGVKKKVTVQFDYANPIVQKKF